MAIKNYFLNGIAELLILSILKKEDTYIYDIKKKICDLSKDMLPMSQNTIYAAAYKLESEGKISEYSKLVGKRRTRIYYHLEDEGQQALDKLLADYQTVTTSVNHILTILSIVEEGKSNE